MQAVLESIGNGAVYVAFADIRAFFTKIPKSVVTQIIAETTKDKEFTKLFQEAIAVELSNLAELQDKAAFFPMHEIGVAQGNSLSPLLGNILLHDFDRQMNEGDCRCIRYIDDFIILAPSSAAARARMRKAALLLAAFGMTLSEEKTSAVPLKVSDKFDFLGIEFNNGCIRPSKKSVDRFEANIDACCNETLKTMRSTERGKAIPRSSSLIATLKRLDGIVKGWGRHYRFCNDENLFKRIDLRVQSRVRSFLGAYAAIKLERDPNDAASLLGIDELARQKRTPFVWPKKASIAKTTDEPSSVSNAHLCLEP